MPGNGTVLALAMMSLYNYGLIPLKGVRNITVFREDTVWTLRMSRVLHQYIPYIAAANFGITDVTLGDLADDIVVPSAAGLDTVTTALSEGIDMKHCNALLTILSGPVGKHATQAWYNLDLPQIMAGANTEAQASTYWDATEGGCYGEIVMESVPPGLELTPTTKAFTDAYEVKAGKYPTYTAFGAYEAIYIIKEAFERMVDGTEPTSENLQTELANTDYYGPRARIKFTNEPLQQGTNSTGHAIDIPGADIINGGQDVHDAWTTNSGSAPPLNLSNTHVLFGQWQKDGTHVPVWGHAVQPAIFVLKSFNPSAPFNNDADYWNYYNTTGRAYCNFLGGHYPDDLRTMINWTEFNHADHGWIPKTTTSYTTTETEPSETSETRTTGTHTTETESSETSVPCEDIPPEVTITGIKDGDTYSNIITIELSITDDSYIDEATIRIEDGEIDQTDEIELIANYATGTSILWTGAYDLDTTNFPDDTYDITIRVYDICDNVKTIRFSVNFNNGITKTEESTSKAPLITTTGFDLFIILIILGNLVFLVKWNERRRIDG
ncbi:MAG: ABC transporter substrate-binding protein [Promethearchaeota archaeon]